MLFALALLAAISAPPGFDKALADLGEPTRRQSAVAKLIDLGPSVVLSLAKAAPGRPEQVQDAIVEALVGIGPAALPELARWPSDVGTRAVAKMGDEVLPVLEAWALDRGSYRWSLAVGSLRAMGPSRALPVLERLTKHQDELVRRAAFKIIASWNDPIIGDVLVRGLDSSDPTIRRNAVEALGALRDRRVIPVALSSIGDDRHWTLQEASAQVLGGQYEVGFRAPLVRASRLASEIMVRRTAADVLEATKDPVANALGHRYSVISVSPVAEAWIGIRYTVMLLGTALAALILLRVSHPLPTRIAVAVTGFVLGGFAWGNLVTKINGSVERELLFFWIPSVWIVARVMGTKMSNLKDLAIPFATALAGGIVGTVLLQIVSRLTTIGGLIVAMYGWVLVVLGFGLGIVVAIRRFVRRKTGGAGSAHEVTFTRLATIGCLAFYAGYVFGWWRLWGYSSDAFRSFL